MPHCLCVSHGCSSVGGKNVDPRTFKAHSATDRQAAFRAAEQNTESTIDTQIEEITAYFSATVLADEVSVPVTSQSTGDSLRSRRNDSKGCSTQDKPFVTVKQVQPQSSAPSSSFYNGSCPQVPSHTSSHSPRRQVGSRRSREDEIIACLADIEVDVDAFYHEALNGLTHLGQPPASGPPSSFPLADLISLSMDLKSRLDIITFKGPTVLERKGSIFLKLQDIDLKLMIATKVWNEELANIKAMKSPAYGLPCDTGKIFFT